MSRRQPQHRIISFCFGGTSWTGGGPVSTTTRSPGAYVSLSSAKTTISSPSSRTRSPGGFRMSWSSSVRMPMGIAVRKRKATSRHATPTSSGQCAA